MSDFDDDRPMRPVSARRRAEQRWRLTEPWRVKDQHRRWRNVVITLGLAAGLATYLAVSSTTSALAPRDIIAVSDTNGHLDLHYTGCGSEGLESVALYPSQPDPSRQPFQGDAIWLIESLGGPVTGVKQFAVGQAPPGFRTLVDLHGLSAFPADHDFWLETSSSTHLVTFPFSKRLLSGNFVITASGRLPLSTYLTDAAHACG